MLFESCPIWCIKISKTDISRHQKTKDFIIFFSVKPPSNTKSCRSPHPPKTHISLRLNFPRSCFLYPYSTIPWLVLHMEIAGLTMNTISPEQVKQGSGHLDTWDSASFDDKRRLVDLLIPTIPTITATGEHDFSCTFECHPP